MNSELSCSQCRDALVELTAGTLTATVRQTVERHLASCPDCQRERDNWFALGDAIRESSRRLPPDCGFSTGLVRLRTTLALQTDDFTNPEGESPSTELDPHSTGTRTPATRPDAAHPTADVSRGRPYPAIAATLALVLVSALVFGTFASRLHFDSSSTAIATATPTPTTTATPTPTSATNTAVQTVPTLPNGANVVSISMVSANDGWAVAGAPTGNATLLHYSNGRWTPSGDAFPDIYLTDISMDSHDDGWAVGAHSDQVTGVVLHYSRGHWSQVQTPNLRFAGSRVWAFSPSQTLVLASLPKDQTGKLGSALERYNNGTWTEIASPTRGITDMILLSAGDFWATCWDGHILHYLGDQWTTFTIAGQGQTLGQGGQPLSISMLSDSNGWVSGFTNANPQGIFLAHFDGHTWTRIAGPAASGPTDINTIAMLSPEEGWAGGDLATVTTQTELLHYVNGQWQKTPDTYSGSIGKIVMVSPTEGWATVGGGSTAGLLHYQNGRWTPYDPKA